MRPFGAPSSQGGFTVVELVACVVVIGVIGAIAAPSFFDHRTFVARGYADDVASSLRYARRIAVASGCKVRVRIDAAGYSGWQQATHASCNGAGAWVRPVLRVDGTRLSSATPADINIGPATAIEFSASGAATTGSSAITIGTHIINVNGATGRVSVQ